MTKKLEVSTIQPSVTNDGLALLGNGTGTVDIGDAALSFPDSDGTNGQVLQTNGSGALSFADQGGGAWEVVSVTDASSSATVDITFTPANSPLFRVIITDLRAATDDVSLSMRLSTDGGSSFAAGNYYWGGMGFRDGSTSLQFNKGQADAEFELTSTSTNYKISSSANRDAFIIVDIPNPSSTAHPVINFQGTWEGTGGETMTWKGGGYYNSTDDTDAVRFLMSSGNIAAGKFTLLQMATS